MADERLQQAIRLVKNGKVMDGRQLLESILKADPHNVPAWLWYAGTWPAASQRISILETCLRVNPGSIEVKQALDAMKSQQLKPSQAPSNAVSVPPADTSHPIPSASSQMPVPASNPQREPEAQAKASLPPSPSGSTSQNRPGGNRRSNWSLWISASALLVFCAVIGVVAFNSIPKNTDEYRHDQPSEHYLYVPKNYSADREWPLFVGIHGFGGSGLDCWNLWQSYADKEGFILACPSLADTGGGWYQSTGETKLFNVINRVRSEYRVSPREFLVGFSAGAQFVQGFAFNYPQYVSGVSILSAGNYYPPNLNARGVPFLVVIGDRDDPISVQQSQAFAATLSRNGFDVQYEVLPGVGHTVTSRGKELTIALFRKTIGK